MVYISLIKLNNFYGLGQLLRIPFSVLWQFNCFDKLLRGIFKNYFYNNIIGGFMSIGGGAFGKKNPLSFKKGENVSLVFFVNLNAQPLQFAD